MFNYITKNLKLQKQYGNEDWKLTMFGEHINMWTGFSQGTIPEYP
jgi:hypothetical protein